MNLTKKYVSTINYSIYYESDEQVDTISDSNKQVDTRSNPMADTHIVDRVRKLSVGVGLFEPSAIGGCIRKDLLTNVQDNWRVELSLNSLSQLNTNILKAFVIGSACNSVGVNSNTLNCTSPDRTIQNYRRIGTPGVNEGFSVQAAVRLQFRQMDGEHRAIGHFRSRICDPRKEFGFLVH